jgi:hypothetical protein
MDGGWYGKSPSSSVELVLVQLKIGAAKDNFSYGRNEMSPLHYTFLVAFDRIPQKRRPQTIEGMWVF